MILGKNTFPSGKTTPFASFWLIFHFRADLDMPVPSPTFPKLNSPILMFYSPKVPCACRRAVYMPKGRAHAEGPCTCRRAVYMPKGRVHAEGPCTCRRAVHVPKGRAHYLFSSCPNFKSTPRPPQEVIRPPFESSRRDLAF